MTDSVRLAAVTKLKQGDLQRVMLEKSWTQADLARYLGINQQDVGCICNMRRVPRLPRAAVEKIVALTGKLPEDLVPGWLASGLDLTDGRNLVRFADVTPKQITDKVIALALPSHEDAVLEKESIQKAWRAAKQILTPRELVVVQHLFGLDGEPELTENEIAIRHFRTHAATVNQIKHRALRKVGREMAMWLRPQRDEAWPTPRGRLTRSQRIARDRRTAAVLQSISDSHNLGARSEAAAEG